ncbi:glycosyltransferase family 4 protein [Candidatus Uhrbacteria bacterium]|nr:glycosyltransferase family 4 protein [Candidatus Uhrbacteria bacterium]
MFDYGGLLVFIFTAVVALLIFSASFFFTTIIRRYALRHQLLDIPNQRSSHTQPTPRGGGVAISLGIFLGAAILQYIQFFPTVLLLTIVGGGALLTTIGILDDRFSISAWHRFIIQGIAAAGALFAIDGFPQVHVGIATVPLGVLGNILGWFWIVGTSNVYNFMDGIDGLAASQAVFVGTVGGMLLLIADQVALGMFLVFVAASAGGFLVWNWPPAKIFMGDSGSVLLGYTFAVIALASDRYAGFPLPLWLMLLAVFIVDAGLSTLRRVVRGERWFEAHRTFAYQKIVQMGYGHGQVVRFVMGTNAVLALIVGASLKTPTLLPASLFASFTVLCLLWHLVQRHHRNEFGVITTSHTL